VLIATATWIINAYKEETLVLPPKEIICLLIILFVLLSISTIDSVSINRSIQELINQGTYLLAFLMIASMRQRQHMVYTVLASLGAASLIVGVLGIREYSLNRVAGIYDWRTFSTFFNPDFLAGFMALTTPISLALYLSKTSLAVSVLSYLWVLTATGNILTSGSRFGVVCATLGILVFGLLVIYSRSIHKVQRSKAILIIVPALLILVTLGKPFITRVQSIKAQSHSIAFRTYTWKGTVLMAKSHPVNGTGIGTFEIAYSKYALVGYTKLAHNSYLQLAAEAGPASTLVLLILLGYSTLPLILRLRKSCSDLSTENIHSNYKWMPDRRLAICGLIGGAMASISRNLVDSDWYITSIGLSFWIILGSAIALVENSNYVFKQFTKRHLTWAIAGIVITTIATLILLTSNYYLNKGNLFQAKGDPINAWTYYRKAVHVNWLNAEAHRRFGMTSIAMACIEDNQSMIDVGIKELKVASHLEPTDAKNFYQLGRIYDQFPNKGDSIKAYKQALKRAPLSPKLLLALGKAYENRNQQEKALAIWKKMVVIEKSPYGRIRAMPEFVELEYVFAHEALGRHYKKVGNTSAACKEYLSALKRIKDYQKSLRSVGPVLEAGGQRDFEMEIEIEDLHKKILEELEQLK
jgi:tetratricopeptide (TPR) repeat protein